MKLLRIVWLPARIILALLTLALWLVLLCFCAVFRLTPDDSHNILQ